MDVAPDNAATVPAKADVDHDGRFDDRAEVVEGAGRAEKCVNWYKGVSDGDNRNKW